MEDRGRDRGSPDFGALLRHYRLAAGLSQEALAERARVSSEGISALERGYRRTPQRETLDLLAEALQLDAEERAFFEAVARPDSRRTAGGSISIGPWPGARTLALPVALTKFIGRTTETAAITALLREHRLVTLTGPGGIGKTQTALRIATALHDAREIPVCFVPLAQDVTGRTTLQTMVADLKDKPLLLILDGCERVIDDAAKTAHALLGGSTRLRILAASREPLRAAGEYAYRLRALPEADAVALFVDRAVATNHQFALSNASAPVVAQICNQLDGIPLAIELAAARMNVLSVNALAERIAAASERGMHPTIEPSYNLLSDREQRVFERLSAFHNGAPLETVAAACADDSIPATDILGLIASLVDKSLVVAEFEMGEPRYRLLEAFRQYAHEKLSARS